MERRTIGSGTPGEAEAGFSRAVRVGNMVFVSGTTAIDAEGRVQHPGDAAAQARYVLNKIGAALKQAGATLGDVVRTRVFLRDIADSHAVARVHREFFGAIRPANTLVRVEPVDGEMLVEIEADAVIET